MSTASLISSATEKPKLFMDMETAARRTGYSLRHFRRIAEEDHVRIIDIRHKFFILTRDLEEWIESRRQRGLDHGTINNG